jgi:serine/threonine protein kinase
MWMLGCIIYELCTLKKPFQSESINSIIYDIINKEHEGISDRYSSDMVYLVDMLLKKDQSDRITIKQILAEKRILKNIGCNSIETSMYFPSLTIDIDDNEPEKQEFFCSLSPINSNRNKLTPTNNSLLRIKNSPLRSPKQIEIDDCMTSLELNCSSKTRRRSNLSSSTTVTTEFIGIKKKNSNPECPKIFRENIKHLTVNFTSEQTQGKQTYDIKEITSQNMPRLKFLTPTYSNRKTTLSSKDVNNSLDFKDYLINKFGKDKCAKLKELYILNNLNEDNAKAVVGEDYPITLSYVKYL